MSKKDKWKMIAIFAIAVLMLGAGWKAYNSFSVADAGAGDKSNMDENTSKLAACPYPPTLNTPTVVDAYNKGTSITVGQTYRVAGAAVGTTLPSLANGDKVQALINATGYVDFVTDTITVKCGANKFTLDGSPELSIVDQSDPTVTIKEDSTTLSDSATGGTSNASNIAAGASYSYLVKFQGVDKKESADMLYVVELASTVNVSSVTMTDRATGKLVPTASVPDLYSNALSGSPYRVAFEVPSVEGAINKEYDLNVAAAGDHMISGAVYTTAYTKQAFQEADGTFVKSGVENEASTATYISTFDYDFWIATA